MLPPDLRRTLVMAIDALRHARDPWWIISSAAVALHGVTPIAVGDVDILTSPADALWLMDRLGIVPIGNGVGNGASSMFRSTLFGRWTMPPLAVEIMADFHVATDRGWTLIAPSTRVPIMVEGRAAHVPERKELAAMLRLFGREKDLQRARLLTSQP